MHKNSFCVVILLALVVPMLSQSLAYNDKTAAAAELTRLATEAGRPYASRDLPTLQRITADDYLQTDVRGGLLNRTQWLDFVKNRRSELTVETDNVEVRFYGQTAVVTGHWIYTKKENGKNTVTNSRWTSVWTKYPGGWKRHVFQNTYVNANADRCVPRS